MKITYKGNLPKQEKAGDAGYDLRALESTTVLVGKTALVKTGFTMHMPEGYAAMVCSRSGMALNSRVFVLNAPGIVDSKYLGDVGVILFNAGDANFKVNAGDRVAQLVFVKVEQPEFTEGDLGTTERGTGGFGSTGCQ